MTAADSNGRRASLFPGLAGLIARKFIADRLPDGQREKPRLLRRATELRLPRNPLVHHQPSLSPSLSTTPFADGLSRRHAGQCSSGLNCVVLPCAAGRLPA